MKAYSLFSIVLAAGKSERFGSTKLLATLNGRPLVAQSARLAEALCGRNSVLVVGHDWQAVADACRPLAGFLTLNSNVERGISESIRAGVRSVDNHADGVLLLLADQPLVDIEHLKTLEQRWRAAPDSIIASGYANTAGPPVIFPQQDFAALTNLDGDRGAKAVLRANRARVVAIPFEPAAVDVDTPADLAALQE